MLKEGSKHYSGLEEAILRNINACKDISNMTKTSLGPNGKIFNLNNVRYEEDGCKSYW